MKRNIFKILAVGAATITLLAGCGGGSEPTPGPNPDPTPIEPEVVKVSEVKLDKSELKIYLTKSERLTATVLPENASNKLLTWSSDNEDVAIVSASGKVTAVGIGTANIKVVSQADNTKFAQCVVTVEREDTTVHVIDVTLDKKEADLYVGKTLQLTAGILPDDASDKGLIWTSSDENVAVVNASGKVSGFGEGDAVIRVASHEKPEIYKECSVHVTIEDTKKHVNTIAIAQASKDITLDLAKTKAHQPSVTFDPVDATDQTLTWVSADPEKVYVDSTSGHIVALAETTEPVLVTATSNDNALAKDTMSVTVVDTTDPTIHVRDVLIDATLSLDLKGGHAKTLSATIDPEGAYDQEVSFEIIGASGIVSLSPIGKSAVAVTPLQVGTTKIVAKSHEDPSIVSNECVVTVTDSTKKVDGVLVKDELGNTLNESDIDIELNSFESVIANVTPEDADNQGIIWSIPEEAKQYISLNASTGSSQVIRGLKATPKDVKFTVTATSAEDAKYKAEFYVTVTDPTIYATGMSIKLNNNEASSGSVELGKSLSLTATVLPENATDKDVVWEVLDDGDTYVALNSLVDKTITVTGKKLTGDNTVTIRAMAKSDNSKYKDFTISVIDPTDVDTFVNFVDPVGYGQYLSRTYFDEDPESSALNLVDGLPTNENLPKGKFFKYGEGDEAKQMYKVGDQGTFRFAPSAFVILKGEKTQTEIKNITTDKKLYKLVDNNYVEADMNEFVDIDDNGVDYTFKSAAVGRQLKLVLTPDSKYYSSKPKTYEFEFQVIRGYNVDELAELSLFDNYQSAWTDYKIAKGLTTPAVGGIILHNDIKIKSEIVPSSFVYSQAEVDDYKSLHGADFNLWRDTYFAGDDAAATNAFVGSPKDYVTFFNRSTLTEGEFALEGNYFEVDASELKKIAKLDPSSGEETLMNGLLGDGSHAQLFGVNVSVGSYPTTSRNITMRNFSVKGNGGLANNDLYKGSIIILKLDSAAFNVENAIFSKTFSAILTQDYSGRSLTSLTADRLISYDAYNSMFYIFGTQNNNISNSWLGKSGGPLAILDEPLSDVPAGQWEKYAATMDCYNCFLKNEVTGLESWFTGHGAASTIQGYIVNPGLNGGWYYNAANSAGGRTIAKDYGTGDDGKVCNFIAIDLWVSSFTDGNTEKDLNGHFRIHNGENNSVDLDMSHVSKNADGSTPLLNPGMIPEILPEAELLKYLATHSAYLFESRENTVASFDMTNLNDLSALKGGSGLFTTEYVSAYLDPLLGAGKFLGVVLGTYSI